MYFVLINDKSNGVYTRQFRCFPMKSFFSRQNTKCYHCYVEKQKNFTPKGWGGRKQAFTLKLDKIKRKKRLITLTRVITSAQNFLAHLLGYSTQDIIKQLEECFVSFLPKYYICELSWKWNPK